MSCLLFVTSFAALCPTFAVFLFARAEGVCWFSEGSPGTTEMDASLKTLGPKRDDKIKEIQWREDPTRKKDRIVKEEVEKKPEPIQFETLEQYELEAAKPRPTKSRDVIDALSCRKSTVLEHLQPSQLKPYGSQDNMYATSLIRPTNLLKYPRKIKKSEKQQTQDHDGKTKNEVEGSGCRKYSTYSEVRELSTSKGYVAKETSESRKKEKNNKSEKCSDDCNLSSTIRKMNALCKYTPKTCKIPWAEPRERFDFTPPMFQARNVDDDTEISYQFSTPAMRRQRKERENLNNCIQYRASYSDLLKLKLKEKEDAKLGLMDNISTNFKTESKPCLGCVTKNASKSTQILQATKNLADRRSITTRSKSNLLSNGLSSIHSNKYQESSPLTKTTAEELLDRKNYSKSSSKHKKEKSRKIYSEKGYNPECENICTPILKSLNKKTDSHIPYEPKPCEEQKLVKKVYLPSHVKLSVPPCTPRPEYRDCKKVDPCPPRADECLVIGPKKLPKLPPGDCPCVEEPRPTIAPKLEKLHFKFEDPPKVICHPPPCQTPRADDANPYRFKPLKPYVPGECECIESPQMKDVKLKRLPKCEPEEICRPPRICPVVEKCPPRADECLRIVPKALPPIIPSPCPCIEPPTPNLAPPIKRLDLHVPEPPKICPRPPPCRLRERADDHLKIKKKKLPKFVPGDCPCEDRPMVDWNLKRLVCEDEAQDCIAPDPCKTFPRADWGCWEYPDEVCEIVDEKCIDKTEKCPSPKPSRGHLCDRYDPCQSGSLRDIRHNSKRKFSNSSASMKLYQQLKTTPKNDDKYFRTSDNSYVSTETKKSKSDEEKCARKHRKSSKKMKSRSTISLIRLLDELERSNEKTTDPLLFKPVKSKRINYENILKKIASSTVECDRKESKSGTMMPTLEKSKTNTIKVSSRAISTSKYVAKDEKDIKNEKACKVKEKCKNIKPSIKSLMCSKKCPAVCGSGACGQSGQVRRGCKVERVPVCCEKEEPPYSAFTDNLQESIAPYKKTSQWTCNRVQYGYHPNFKKEFEPLNKKSDKKNKKSFSTSTLSTGVTVNSSLRNIEPLSKSRPVSNASTRFDINKISTRPISREPPKALLTKSANSSIIINQSRKFSTIIFEIKQPVTCKKPKSNKNCPERFMEKTKVDKITCTKTDRPCEPQPRWCCKRDYTDPNCKRKAPPFPAFSDCLDEEMEDILTECPLDREKYLRMQPRFMNPPKKPFTLNPPPPIQGRIDLLKEQECLREKLNIENVGLTQSCSNFGEPVPLMKTKKLITHENKDCRRIEELKKAGRWPPFTLKQNRRLCTSTSINLREPFRNLSTLGLNSVPEITKDDLSSSSTKRIYVRNYHALIKNSDKALLIDSESKLKELTQKMFPDMNESTKLLRLRNKQEKIRNPKNYELLSRKGNAAQRALRFYTTYKTKHKNFLKRKGRGCIIRTHIIQRGAANKTNFLKGEPNFKENRSHKSSRQETDVQKEHCPVQTSKKICSKFTLSNCPSREYRKTCHRKSFRRDCAKPFSPYPAFSECTNNEFSSRPCECPNENDTDRTLQPKNSMISDQRSAIQQFPEQDKIDKSLGFEYYRCKHGLINEGTTLDCETFGYCIKKAENKDRRDVSDASKTDDHCESNSKSEVVEFLVQEHINEQCKSNYEKVTTCCSQSPSATVSKNDTRIERDDCEADRKKLEEICMDHCFRSIPCHLPEEEKFCICQKECKKIFEVKNNLPEIKTSAEETVRNPEPKTVAEAQPLQCENVKKVQQKILKSKDCEAVIQKHAAAINKPIVDKCGKRREKCSPEPAASKAVVLKTLHCPPKKAKSITQLENLWQRVVNYFKARPNCPEPGEWKKIALREKAEKAAKAAGLIALDPNCLSPEILRTAKIPKKDCKVCPNKDLGDKKEPDSESNKTASPKLTRRNYSTVVLPARNYSKSCQELEEINKLLEEAELENRNHRYRCSSSHVRNGYALSNKECIETEALRMSLDKELNKYVDLRNLCYKGDHPRNYFGYSNVIPSRENILERAWRLTIESYNRYNCPKTFFNEFFNKIESSIQSVEDLEKLKTENVLRELDEFLKNQDSDKNKK